MEIRSNSQTVEEVLAEAIQIAELWKATMTREEILKKFGERLGLPGDESMSIQLNLPQEEFDQTIGRLDHVLSKLVGWGRASAERNTGATRLTPAAYLMDEANQQTLKHHAEDMIAAGNKILYDLKLMPKPKEREETS